MNHIKIYILAILTIFLASSCDDYLSVELQDQMTLDEVFDKRATTEAYLAQVYGYLPVEYNPLGNEGSVVPRSDEASFSWISIEYINFNNGSWGPTSWAYKTWAHNYVGINQATIFMNNVDKC